MSTVTENDLQELKDLIIAQNQKIDQLSRDNTEIKNNLTQLTINQIKLEGNIDNINARLNIYKPNLDKIPDLAEKIGELKGWRVVSLVIFLGFVTSIYLLIENW
jgi:small-conductance mechanosensitive channel